MNDKEALLSYLPEEDKNMFIEYVNICAEERTKKSADYLLRCWSENKENLFEIFNKNFILERKYLYKTPDNILKDTFIDLIYSEEKNPINIFRANFLDLFGDSCKENWWCFTTLLSSNSLATNIYSGEDFNITLPDGGKYKIVKGQKVSRVLGKIAKAFNIAGYEEFRILHSQILNQKKLEGTLCLSIHPMDYLTMSDNECGWSSCMSWIEDGCYRQGTIEMMNSPYVVVAYLKSNEDMRVQGGYTWNNKKWRELFIINDDIIANVKGYPYRNDEFTKAILDWLRELNVKVKYRDTCFKYDAGGSIFDEKTNEKIIEKMIFSTECMYNDFNVEQFCYINQNINNLNCLITHYSGPSECMSCGELNPYFQDESCLCCEDCYAERAECELCGNEFLAEECSEIDGAIICPYCQEKETRTDDIYGRYHLLDNLTLINLKIKNKIFYNQICSIYERDIFPDDSAFKHYHHIFDTCYIDYVDIKDCSNKDINAFGYKNIEECLDFCQEGEKNKSYLWRSINIEDCEGYEGAV